MIGYSFNSFHLAITAIKMFRYVCLQRSFLQTFRQNLNEQIIRGIFYIFRLGTRHVLPSSRFLKVTVDSVGANTFVSQLAPTGLWAPGNTFQAQMKCSLIMWNVVQTFVDDTSGAQYTVRKPLVIAKLIIPYWRNVRLWLAQRTQSFSMRQMISALKCNMAEVGTVSFIPSLTIEAKRSI